MATMSEVARHAGVALSTVSYMLSGDRPVSPATKERIEQAMTELGYRPNAIARSLASRRTRILALHLPELDFTAGETVFEIVRGAYDRASELGYLLSVWPIDVDRAPEELIDLVGQGHADGVLLVEVGIEDRRIDALSEADVPFLSIGRTGDTSRLPYVDIDFEATVREALDELIELGHRDVALLGRSSALEADGYAPAVRSHESFARIAGERGIRHREYTVEASPQAGRALARDLFSGEDRPDAVIALNDLAVVGLVNELALMGVELPRDLSVVTVVSSRRTGSMTTPTLAGWQGPGEEMGRRAVDGLLARLDDPESAPSQVLVTCTRYHGDSVSDRRDPTSIPIPGTGSRDPRRPSDSS
ncbi:MULTISPECIES: LacI family DNA-binding transcriptional regulator [unclassified Brachybacterium]|uniref:LacI family DNA-binding transcriptional regulator n=1 Tax=unclassified Brachybacterium TaxID=2623841 RepID=UPI003611C37A